MSNIFEQSNEDNEDYTMAGRHEQIIKEGNTFATIVTWVTIFAIALLCGLSLFVVQYVIGRLP